MHTTANPRIQLTIARLEWECDNINTELPSAIRIIFSTVVAVVVIVIILSAAAAAAAAIFWFLCHRLLISHELIFIYLWIDWHSIADLLTFANSSSSIFHCWFQCYTVLITHTHAHTVQCITSLAHFLALFVHILDIGDSIECIAFVGDCTHSYLSTFSVFEMRRFSTKRMGKKERWRRWWRAWRSERVHEKKQHRTCSLHPT